MGFDIGDLGGLWIVISAIIITFFLIAIIRVVYVVYRTGKPWQSKSRKPLSTLIVLGSGGHTAEMINVLRLLQNDRFTPRFYVAAATDNMSLQKAWSLEESLGHVATSKASSERYLQIYRSREVGQSYLTSIATTVIAITDALWLMIRVRPQVVLCNGPGTCIPLCLIAFLFKILGIRWSSIVYIESIARVKRLSLSGLLLYNLRIADQFFVQWPQLQRKYPRAQHVGRLM